MFSPTRRQPFICLRCLSRTTLSTRPYSNSAPTLPPPPPPSGAAKLKTRRLLFLHGLDAAKFLQGIVTANVRPGAQSGFFAAFLTAQGKVLHDVFVYPTAGTQWYKQIMEGEGGGGKGSTDADEPGFLVEVDAGQAEMLLKHVKRHKLRANLQLRLLQAGELDVWSVWREEEKWTRHSSTFAEKPEESASVAASSGPGDLDGQLGLVDSRAPGMGRRILLPSTATLGDLSTLEGLEEVPLSAYTLRRYLRGVAEGQAEIPRDNVLPMNANLDTMGAIDFKKGCYIGQELTIRTHHTGVVRRRILPVSLYEPSSTPPEKLEYNGNWTLETPAQDTDISVQGKRGKPGKWIAGVGNVGLAMCRLEMMTDLQVTGEPSTFSADDRFAVKVEGENGEQEAGVKAFVPDWLRGKIRTPKVLKRVE